MATRHGRSFTPKLQCEALEPRNTPAADPVIDYAAGFARGDEFRGLPGRHTADDLVLTDGPLQARAVWVPDRVHVGAFETSFVFRQEGHPCRLGDGFTFALTGTGDNIGQPGTGGAGLGYQGLTNSVAVKFDLVDNDGEGRNSVGVFTGGSEPTVPAVRLDDTPINLHAQHPIRTDISYNGTVLTVTLTDNVRPDHTWTHQFPIDIPAAVGGPTAFVGFTAGTGELSARQAIDSWTFAEVVPVTPVSQPPEFTVPVQVTWVSPGTVALTARVTDDGGVAGLTHTWEIVSAPDGGTRRLPPWADDPGRPIALVSGDYGPYTFRLTVRDAEGQTAVGEVTYVHGTTVRRLDVVPAAATVAPGGTVQFTAVEYDEAGNRIQYPLAPGWSVVEGPGTVDEAGRYTAPADASGTATIQALVLQAGNRGMSLVYVGNRATVTIVSGRPPSITSARSDVTSATNAVALGVEADDEAGPAELTYTWEVVSAPPGAVVEIGPGSAATPGAAAATVTKAGPYTFRVTVRDPDGQTATAEASALYPANPTTMEVSAPDPTVPAGGSVRFVAVVRDQFGDPLPDVRPQWQVASGPGTIDDTGLYTAPSGACGRADVRAVLPVGPGCHVAALTAESTIEVLPAHPPEITSLTANPSSGPSAILHAVVSDEDGPAGLTYTCEVVSMPPGGPAQLTPFTDPSSAIAQMTRGGVYTFRLTVRDATGLTASREVGYPNPTIYASLEVTPERATVPAGGSVQFTAVVHDTWGFVVPDPRPVWQVIGPGTVDASGLYTAPVDGSGGAIVSAMTYVRDPRYADQAYAYSEVQIEPSRPPASGLDFANESALLAEATAALDRIDAGTFGQCEGCGKKITRPRLDAVPYARHCIRCAKVFAPAAGGYR